MESSVSPIPQKRRIPGLPNPVVEREQQKWLFTDSELERTPSRIDKISREKEDHIRHRAVQFIWEVSMMLKLPPQTSMTATVYMHRFLMRYSLMGQYPEVSSDLMHPKVIAGVALFLAFKVDETMRRMKDFVVACCRVAMKQPDLVVDEQSKDYWKWRDLILQNESVMLEFLCFDLQLESPYRILWEYSLFLGIQDHRPLRHAAYAFLNDSTYTVLCLQFPPRVIAAAALYAAARYCHVAFPDDDTGHPWWDQIDVRVDDLIRACKFIVQIYERVQQTLSKGYPDFVFDPNPQDPTRRLLHDHPPSTPAHHLESALNGRKRSREPESEASFLLEKQPAHSANGEPEPEPELELERSPKRQRSVLPATGGSAATTGAHPEPSRPRIPLRAMRSTSTRPIPTETTDRPPQQQVQITSAPQDEISAEEGQVSETTAPPHRHRHSHTPVGTAAVERETRRIPDRPDPEKGEDKKNNNNNDNNNNNGDGDGDGDEGRGSEEGEI